MTRNLSQCEQNKLKNQQLLGLKIKLKKSLQKLKGKQDEIKQKLLGGSGKQQKQTRLLHDEEQKQSQDQNLFEENIQESEEELTKYQLEQLSGGKTIPKIFKNLTKLGNINQLNKVNEITENQENKQQTQIIEEQKIIISLIDKLIEKYNKEKQKIDQISIKQIKSEGIFDEVKESKQNIYQFEQECVFRDNPENYVFKDNPIEKEKQFSAEIQLDQLKTKNKKRRKLNEKDEVFLRQIFKLGEYINSGGEADIFIHKDNAFRLIKIDDENGSIEDQLSELSNIKQFQQEQNVLDLNISHILEDKINKTKYIIHGMQICSFSLQKELQQYSNLSLSQVLRITFTLLHFLISLRQNYIYHSDIKPGNILKIHKQYKAADFGASQVISFCNPFNEPKMWTSYYTPSKNTSLPFYHDIYSVGKTIQLALNKLDCNNQTYKKIKEDLAEIIQQICLDDENSINIDCFQLPKKCIECFADEQDQEINEFFDEYLVQIEQYLNIKKESKAFLYELQFQYAQIALQILSNKNLNLNIQKSWQEKIIIKALETKIYILFKQERYQEVIESIEQALNLNFYQQNSLEIIIRQIKIIIKILFKQNAIGFYSVIHEKLMKTEKNSQICEVFQELKIKTLEFSLQNADKIQEAFTDFYYSLEALDQEQKLKIIYKVLIKYINYLQEKNVYDKSIYDFILFCYEDEFNHGSYYQEKLLKTIGLYLYKFLFQKGKVDIKFYLSFENEFLLLPQIIFKYLSLKQDHPFEACFDESIWEYYFLLLNLLNSIQIYNFENSKKQIDDLIEKYEKMMPITRDLKQQKKLPYYEQRLYNQLQQKYYQKHNKKMNSDQFEFFNQVNDAQCEKEIIKQIKMLSEQVYEIRRNKQNSSNDMSAKNLLQKSQLNNIVEYFDCEELSLQFIGSQQQFNQKLHTIISQLDYDYLTSQYKYRQEEREKYSTVINFRQITDFTINLQNRDSTHCYIQNHKSLVIFLKQTNDLNLVNVSPLTFMTSSMSEMNTLTFNLRIKDGAQYAEMLMKSIQNVKNLISLSFQLNKFSKNKYIEDENLIMENKIGDEGAYRLANALECCQNVQKLNLDLRGNNIGCKGAQSIAKALMQIQNVFEFNLNLDGNEIGIEGAQSISNVLQNFKNITKFFLDLCENQIHDEGANSIAKALENFENISELNLNLSMNSISTEGAKSITNSLKNIQNISLFNLNLSQNQIQSEGAQYIATVIKQFKVISSLSLDLNGNKIDIVGAQNITQALKNLESISQLNLNLKKNNIGHKEVQNLIEFSEKYQKLDELNLDLNENDIRDGGCQSIGKALEKCLNITKLNLDLSNNCVGNEGIASISKSLQNHKNITNLNICLRENNFGDQGIQSIASTLKQCQNLSQLTLDFYSNNISDERANFISNSLKKCHNIKQLSLNFGNNYKLGVKGAQSIAHALQKLQFATQLDLDFWLFTLQDYRIYILLQGKKQSGRHKGGSKIFHATQEGRQTLEYTQEIGDEGAQSLLDSFAKCLNIFKLKLCLAGNKISNEGARFIAESLEKYKHIDYLTIDLTENYIGYEGAQSIVNVLKQCQTFIELNIYLYENNIDYYISESILDDLKESQQNTNQLTYDQSEYAIKFRDQNHLNKQEIPQNITHLLNLNLSQNQLNNENTEKNKMDQLKIYLNWNQIYLEIAKNIAKYVQANQKIDQINLTLGNQFGIDNNEYKSSEKINFHLHKYTLSLNQDEIQFIEADRSTQRKSYQLDLYIDWINIGDIHAQSLVNTVFNMPNMTQLTLDLVSNNISDQQICSISGALENCQHINQLNLYLAKNVINDLGVQSIISACIKCQNIIQLNLNLSQNNISYEGAQIISSTLKQRSNIKELILDLEGNKISKKGYQNTLKSLQQCKKITQLKFYVSQDDGFDKIVQINTNTSEKRQDITKPVNNLHLVKMNNISQEEIQNIARALEKCSNITQLNLNLSNNKIGDEGIQFISNSLEKFLNITQLNLNFSNIKIDQFGAQSIANALEKYQNITHLNLDLSSNSICSEGFQKVEKALETYKNITQLTLNLSSIIVDDPNLQKAHFFVNTFENYQMICQLNLNLQNNYMDKLGAQGIAKALKDCKNITKLSLNLSENQLGRQGAQIISESLENCLKITQLDLSFRNNYLDLSGAQKVFKSLGKIQFMTQLNLDLGENSTHQNLGRQLLGAKGSIIKPLENLKNITQLYLNLEENYFSDKQAQFLVNDLQKCQKITHLNLILRKNQISCQAAQNIKDILKNCQNIIQLSIDLEQQNKD